MSENETTLRWEKKAKKALVGKVIGEVRYLTAEELEGLMWEGKSLVIIFTDGTWMFPSADDEGNGPGALFTNIKGLETIPVCR